MLQKGTSIEFIAHRLAGGAQQDHTAQLDGTAKLDGKVAVFQKGKHRLKISFGKNSATILTLSSRVDLEKEYGFGAGASLDGVYIMKSSRVPDFKGTREALF